MEKKLLLKLIFLGSLLLFGIAFLPYDAKLRGSSNEDLMFVPDEITIEFKEQVGVVSIVVKEGVITTGIPSIDSLNQKYQGIAMYKVFPGEVPPVPGSAFRDLSRYYNLRFSKVPDLDFLVTEYSQNVYIKSAEKIPICSIDATPNDPEFSQQWGLHQASDKDIDAPEAWEITKGNSSILLAIVDTGIDWNHPDLAGSSPYTNGNVWINWTEWNGTSGVDDDANGYVDDIRGWDWVTGVSGSLYWQAAPGEDGETEDNDPMDFQGHGTHVAGIAAAMTNNSTRVSGVAGGWYTSQRGCQIISLRAGWKANDGLGYLYMSFCASAINYARVKQATVINCSWYSEYYSALEAAIDNAINAGIVVVKSAGNKNSETADYLNGRGDCISVAATDQNDAKASFSNYGTWVDVSAPGVNIRSTLFNNTSGNMSGTSMAAAFVTGLVGLVKSSNSSLNRNQITSTIILSADNIDAQNPNYIGKLGSGRINANKSVRNLYVPQVYTTISSALNAATSGKTVIVFSGTFTESNNLTVNSGVTLQLNPGVTLRMASGKKLTINGTLSAQGTSGNRITFQSISGTWYGIELNYCSGTSIKYCTVKNASYGVRAYHTPLYIENCSFTSNAIGIKYDNQSGGWVENSTISSSYSGGIDCSQNSNPTIRPYNCIWSNSPVGVYGDYTSLPELGTSWIYGNNSIKNNGPDDVWSENSNTVYAQYNYWGSSSPDPNVSDNVVWEPYLTSDPTGGGLLKPLADNTPFVLGNPAADTTGKSEFGKAYLVYLSGDYATALVQFKELVTKYPESVAGLQALALTDYCYQNLANASAALSYLDQVGASYAGKEISGLAQSIAVGHLVKLGSYQEAITKSDQILQAFPDKDLAKYALYDLGTIYWFFMADQKIGESYYRQLIAKYPDDDLSISALTTLGEWQPGSQPKPEAPPLLTDEHKIPAEFRLEQNYPNPFNPETLISYQLPEASAVTVQIYNLLGQKMRMLVDEEKAAGCYSVIWDGKDDSGLTVASGIYVYVMMAGEFKDLKKTVLVR